MKLCARSRALNESEIWLFLNRLDAAPLRSELKSALRLILLTLTRKSEVRLARWEHINFERGEWEIPQENSKTGAGQIVYLAKHFSGEKWNELTVPRRKSAEFNSRVASGEKSQRYCP